MRLKIVQTGDPVLRLEARPLTSEEMVSPDTRSLIQWMHETMVDAPGVGLAAPQIGLSIQLAVIEDLPERWEGATPEWLAERERKHVPFLALINPRTVARSEEPVEFFEGCLSVAGFSALVRRSRAVTVEYWDETGAPQQIEASGWPARILQHEIDHLNGRLYLDLMESRSFMDLDNFNRHWKDLEIREVRERLRLSDAGGD